MDQPLSGCPQANSGCSESNRNLFGLATQQSLHNLFPFGFQRKLRVRLPCLAVLVAGVPVFSFFAVKIRMDPGSIGRLDLLRNIMRASPVAFAIPT
jgi:hypothetical protein